MNKDQTKESSTSRWRRLFSKKNIFIWAVVILFLIQYIQISRVFGTFSVFDDKDSSLIKEIGQIKDAYFSVGQDLNEVRAFLRMPKSNYSGFEEIKNKADEEDKNKNVTQLALFKYIGSLAAQKNLAEKVGLYKSFLENLKNSENFKKFLLEQNLSLSSLFNDDSNVSIQILGPSNENLILYYLSKEDGKFWLKTPNIKKDVNYISYLEFEKSTIDFVKSEKESLIKQIRSVQEKQKSIAEAIKAKATQNVLDKLEVKLEGNFIDKDLKFTYSIFNKTGELIGEVVLDTKTLEIFLVDKNHESISLKVTDVASALPPFLEKLNTRSFVEKKADQLIKELEDTLNEDGFKLLLSESGFKISEKPRPVEDRLYYDIFDKNGVQISSLAVEKTTGVINVVKPDGTNAQNLLFFEENKKKTLKIPDEIPNYEEPVDSDDGFNILISGKNGSLVDTMIFAHIDEQKGSVRMISIPRDLHYNGRKINSLAYYYGMPELKKVLSEISGYELDKYILIDMYAFIEVIDLIGGIDIHLENAVIDPTYRTEDNGKVGTLHYEPGDYHLGGKEALRLARTRHTSSDFARAERQQKILESLQDKARNFGFGDADTIYEIARTVLSKTETDITLDEAIAYYFRYQNYKIESNEVLSSGNVLYVPPYITEENCQKLIEAALTAAQLKPECENENHAFTLLPLNDNWNIIKWFFRQKFEG